MEDRNMAMARRVAQRVQQAGGETYFVGGIVRDRLMGRACKDVDIEVHGIAPDKLKALLSELGECTEMGASFGVYGLRHYQLDIAMPRKETATGRGHRDFAIDVDPFAGTRQAAVRRDFTINAMMENVLTGEIVDHFGGRRDLEAGILRHVNDASFAEDPLRVLRGAQFAARFGFRMAPETLALCGRMDLSALARERVMEELKKALLKAPAPGIFFSLLREMNQLSCWFPEVQALIGVPQEPRYHPEGDVWNHTLQVVDRAAALREHAANPEGLMLSALCHDLGKPTCTCLADGRIRAIGHEKLGVPLAHALLERLTGEKQLQRYVENMVLLHMRPGALTAQHSGRKAWMRLLDQAACPEDLLLLARADNPQMNAETAYEMLENYRRLMAQPWITGAEVRAAGVPQGPAIGRALACAHKLRLAGVDRDAALAQALQAAREEA